MAGTGWTELATVASDSEPGVVHVIKQHADGRVGCSCLAFRFARKDAKTCKHIRALHNVKVLGAFRTDGGPSVVVAAGIGAIPTERFTVRRAISFTNV